MNELDKNLTEEFKDKEYAHAYADEFLDASIATQIKVLREQNKLTQQELADLTGMKQERISLLENINYSMWSISTLKKLAEAFDVTLRVSFEDFATRINDIANFSRESLQRLPREEALAQKENQITYSTSAFRGGYNMIYKRATQKLRDAGILDITIYKRLYGAAPENDRFERQTSRCFKTPAEAADAVINGFRPTQNHIE